MVVESGRVPVLPGLIFARVEQGVPDVAAVVQHLARPGALLVIDLDDGGLAVGGDRVVIEEAGGRKAAVFELPPELRVLLLESVVVLEPRMEQVAAVLDVAFSGLPEDVEQVDALDGDVAEAAGLVRVPEDLVRPGPGLELLPHGLRVGLLEAVLLEDDRQDLRQDAGLLPVVGLAGQDVRLGKGVHGVGVLGDDHIVQPAADGLKAAEPVGALFLLGAVAQLPPVFGGHASALDADLAGLVLLQDARERAEPALVHGQGSVFFHWLLLPIFPYCFSGSISSSRCSTGRSGATGRDMQR